MAVTTASLDAAWLLPCRASRSGVCLSWRGRRAEWRKRVEAAGDAWTEAIGIERPLVEGLDGGSPSTSRRSRRAEARSAPGRRTPSRIARTSWCRCEVTECLGTDADIGSARDGHICSSPAQPDVSAGMSLIGWASATVAVGTAAMTVWVTRPRMRERDLCGLEVCVAVWAVRSRPRPWPFGPWAAMVAGWSARHGLSAACRYRGRPAPGTYRQTFARARPVAGSGRTGRRNAGGHFLATSSSSCNQTR
jgi:hypothetical protein